MGGGVMLRQLALHIDIFVLGLMTNMQTVGLFGGPYRLSWSLRTLPQTLSLPLYPLYSRTAHFSPQRFGDVYRQSLKFFTLISVPFAAFFIAWSKPLLTLALGGRFLAALPAMQLLGLGLIPFFVSCLFQYLFAALDAQKGFFVSTLIGSVVRVILLVTLIPRYNPPFVAPAIAFLCAEVLTRGNVDRSVAKAWLSGPSHEHYVASTRGWSRNGDNPVSVPRCTSPLAGWRCGSFPFGLRLGPARAQDFFERRNPSGAGGDGICLSFRRVVGQEIEA
jgi:hypothetical protein